MKKYILLFTAIVLSISLFSACGNSTSAEDAEVMDSIYAYFSKLAEIPRPTYNEQQVSDYLRDWAKERGYEVTQDENNNIIFDVPATEGMESTPIVILQGHMDMVALAEDGYDFNPEEDSIKPVRDGNTITAEHTSLGADDGIGISIIQHIIENNTGHGPLRIIITTDEEQSQTGALNLDRRLFGDAKYLINIDSENSDTIIVSSASNIKTTITKQPITEENQYDTALELSVSGSSGGHSGIDIDKNRVNSIIALFDLIKNIKNENVEFKLVSAEGGTAYNAIPISAKAVIVCDSSTKELIEKIAKEYSTKLQDEYIKDNPDIAANVAEINESVTSVISDESTSELINFVTSVNNGVYTMSSKIEGFTECSSNLGVISVASDNIEFSGSIRSSESTTEQELLSLIEKCCKDNGFTFSSEVGCKAWPIKANSKLTELASSIYKEQNGEDAKVLPIHGGLECGTFSDWNKDLDIISVGPDITNPHSPKESCDLASAVKTLKMIEAILSSVK